ncbi:hypothetical protein, partial [Vibrio diabolicus]
PEDLTHPVTVVSSTRLGQEAREFRIHDKHLLVLLEKDLEWLDELTLDQAAERVRVRLENVRIKVLELHSNAYLIKAAGKTVLVTLIFLVVVQLLRRGHLRARRWFANNLLQQKGLIPHQWRQVLGNLEIRVIGVFTLLVILLLT